MGVVKDFVVNSEYQKRGGIHWHILFWVESGTAPDNVVMAEMPRYCDTSNVQAQYARRMVQKYQMHRECYPSRCFKGYGVKMFHSRCLNFDDEGIRFIYKGRFSSGTIYYCFGVDQ